ncbi:hypothetical protein RYZ26_18020 [Terasakiella sp. A23]|uniref:hypothetical protein n=1 Tax=Terasakiella sp. FCG-A23 TaxID=3080561 RepID=UPI0029548A92|nr:hypothetical protein [Terasakiella sp. A23]MDV7341512.1 hypothetical protein [Terasakiella sp. A23]
MSAQHIERSRLKLQLDKTIRELNKEIINPEIPELKLTDLEPVLKLVARTRAAYLKELLQVTQAAGEELPSPEQLRQFAHYRETYEELLKGSQALEAAIDRGYLDVLS